MNAQGAKKWKKITENNIDRQVAIVLDNYVYSFPTVNDVIPNGSSSISGNFTVEEAEDLSNILKAGKLPAPAKIIQSEIVGPSLGQRQLAQVLHLCNRIDCFNLYDILSNSRMGCKFCTRTQYFVHIWCTCFLRSCIVITRNCRYCVNDWYGC